MRWLPDRKTLVRAFWLAIAVLYTVAAGVGVYRTVHRHTDFTGFHSYAGLLISQGRVFTQDNYPPSFHLLMVPFAALPLLPAAILWQLMNLASLAALPAVFHRLGRVSTTSQILPWLVVLPFVLDNLRLAQNAPMLLLLVSLGLVWIRGARPVLGGVLVGVAALVKVFPVLVLAVGAIFRRFWRPVLGAVAAALVVAAGLVILVGAKHLPNDCARWISYVHERQSPALWTQPEGAPPLRYNNQGLPVVLVRTLCRIRLRPRDRAVHLADWPVGVGLALYAVIAAATAVTWCAAAWRCSRRRADEAWLGMLALTVLAVLVLSPLVRTHYFIWWVPGVVFLADRRRFLAGLMAVSIVGLMIIPARALGLHTWLSLLIFFLVFRELWRMPAHAPEPSRAEGGITEKHEARNPKQIRIRQ